MFCGITHKIGALRLPWKFLSLCFESNFNTHRCTKNIDIAYILSPFMCGVSHTFCSEATNLYMKIYMSSLCSSMRTAAAVDSVV